MPVLAHISQGVTMRQDILLTSRTTAADASADRALLLCS
jgi:hypothetical protein